MKGRKGRGSTETEREGGERGEGKQLAQTLALIKLCPGRDPRHPRHPRHPPDTPLRIRSEMFPRARPYTSIKHRACYRAVRSVERVQHRLPQCQCLASNAHIALLTFT
jgi:hypothetical protein